MTDHKSHNDQTDHKYSTGDVFRKDNKFKSTWKIINSTSHIEGFPLYKIRHIDYHNKKCFTMMVGEKELEQKYKDIEEYEVILNL